MSTRHQTPSNQRWPPAGTYVTVKETHYSDDHAGSFSDVIKSEICEHVWQKSIDSYYVYHKKLDTNHYLHRHLSTSAFGTLINVIWCIYFAIRWRQNFMTKWQEYQLLKLPGPLKHQPIREQEELVVLDQDIATGKLPRLLKISEDLNMWLSWTRTLLLLNETVLGASYYKGQNECPYLNLNWPPNLSPST